MSKQRFHCKRCQRTFIWKVPSNKSLHLQHWFQLWVQESYSIRQLCQLSGYSASTLKNIKNHWLDHQPREQINYANIQYLVYDATYFHQDGCLMNLMDAQNQQIIAHRYIRKESFQAAYPWLRNLSLQGLSPGFITTDGEQSVLRALRLVWPQAKLQRCLYHLQHEGMRWLRSDPKTEAGRQLRDLLSRLSWIKTIQERDSFINSYKKWLNQYQDYVLALPRSTTAFKDLQRTIVLLNNALPDMFYYLQDEYVPATTNALEGFHSRLKADYQRHRGLSKDHKISYIHWYCYFKNKRQLST